jgi:hypothetical protein
MMAKVLIAVLAGFAVAVPSTFFLLKKVRIKSEIRHFQVSTALGMPIALFIYLLQTSYALPVVVITVVLSLLVVALELTLRSIVAHLPASRADGQTNKIGSGVSFDEARNAAGAYPDDYMTEAVWLEMQEFMKSRSLQKQNFKSSSSPDSPVKSFEMHANINFVGANYLMIDGVRNTTDSINSSDKSNLLLFGGSTVLCEEVPDRLTNASILQRILNSFQESVQVFNYGASGATTIDRVQMLLQYTKVKKDDIVVFYFGDNDSGWIDHRAGKPSEQLVWLPIRVLRAMSDFGSETAKWMYGEFAPRSFRKFSRQAVKETINALNLAFEHCSSEGAHMVAVLQPNLYTLLTKSEYEKKLEGRFSRDIKTLIIDAYKNYEVWIKTVPYGVAAMHIFDHSPAPVFLDWSHVNARGNELIAKFIYSELAKRKLVNVLNKV